MIIDSGVVTGSLQVSGSLNVSVSASAKTFFGSGSSQFGYSVTDVQSIYGTLDVKNGPVLVTGSLNVANRITVGELTVLYGITGSIAGTASYIEFAQSASLALSAETAISASHANTSNTTISSSYALQAQAANTASLASIANTASYVNLAESASYVQFAQTASYIILAQTASYVLQAQNAFSASLAAAAQTANTASYINLAESASYVQFAQTASYVTLAQTASYILSAQSASHALFTISASNAQTASSAANNFVVNGIMGVGGSANGLYQVYVTTSIDDGTLGLDSSGNYNAMYFLKGGLKKFEISTAGGDQTPVTQLIPYTSSGFFQIGNPSNASSDMIFLSEPTGGRVILGPGIATGSMSLSGSQQTDLVQFTGNTFVSGALTILGTQYAYGPIEAFNGLTGSLNGTANTANTASYATFAENASTAATAATASIALAVSSSISSQNIQHNVLFVDTTGPGAVQVDGGLRYNPNTNLLTTTASLASLAETASYATTAPFYVLTSSYNTDSSSLSTRTTNLESTASTLTSASASFASSINDITSVYATTGSNTFTGTQYISNDTNATTFTSTAALYTDGGLRVNKDTFISGSLSVAGNFNLFGTASISYVTTSVFVGLEYINLNTELPALRYAGINVGDSGSASGISSSYWYDSQKDNWLFVYSPAAGGQVTSSLAINGPIAYNNLGNEQGLIGNYIVKAQLITAENNHHVTSSQIFDDGTTVAIAGNLQVTGSLRAANLTGSLNGSNLVAASVANDRLTNSSVTVTAGTGMSGGGTVALGSSVTLTNAGVTSNVAGTGVTVSGATGAVTISIGQAVGTASNVQFNSLGVGTAGSGTAGEIRATADVTAFYSSDERLKGDITPIENPIEKLKAISGVTFNWKEGFNEVHSHTGTDTGVIAQQIEAIELPGTVTTRDNGYKAVNYEKLNALLIEGFKAQQAQLDAQKLEIEELKAKLK